MVTKTLKPIASDVLDQNGQQGVPAISLHPLDLRIVEVPVVGDTEYISHRWSEKAKAMMLAAQTSKTRVKKQPKDPQADYEGSIYRLDDGRSGIPAAAFKVAIVGACRLFEGVKMTHVKTVIRVLGEGPEQLVPIEAEPYMREDMVRLETGVADIRYRAGFWPWAVLLRVRYVATVIDLSSVINLVDAAGQGGVGEWRPSAPKSSSGSFGTFHVERKNG
jgi:hypothetical protein